MALEFTSTKAGKPAEVPFKVDGEKFRCVLRKDADAVLEWSELAAASGEEDLKSAAGVAFTSRFFRLMMLPDEYARFRAHLKDTDPEILVEIMQAINEEMEETLADDTSRPTQPSSSSSRGRGGQDERTLKIISLSAGDGDVEIVRDERQQGRSSTRRQPRRQQQRRRRAG